MLRALPTIAHFSALTVVFIVTFATDPRLPLSVGVGRGAGAGLTLAGLGLMGWAVAHLRFAVLGLAEPRRRSLLTSGPYRLMRHPIYAGFALAVLGVVVWEQSLLGLVAYLALFLPSEIYRARTEERALSRKFGEEWTAYSRRTGFFVPQAGRERS